MAITGLVLGAIVFRYRHALKRWLHDPKYGSEWRPSRETILRRRIEDANEEIFWIEEREKETETGD